MTTEDKERKPNSEDTSQDSSTDTNEITPITYDQVTEGKRIQEEKDKEEEKD